MSKVKMNFPQLIKSARKTLGETQEQFAARFSTQANTVSRWETGSYQAPYEVLEFALKQTGAVECPPGLVTFLYVLLRDHLPAGAVEQLMRDHVVKAEGRARTYSNQHLEAYARELAARLV